MAKDVKRMHPALIGVLAVGLVLLLVRLFPISISIQSSTPRSPLGVENLPAPPAASPTAPPLSSQLAADSPASGVTGSFRVSNQTPHPVRVALLSRGSISRGDTSGNSNGADAYGSPAHWDFAPEEGREKGLLLSLPDKKLQLQPGDVLVAFAQDGSQRYWGPYVVGQTPEPLWKAQGQEWWLLLRP
jgi:hypothetical protein